MGAQLVKEVSIKTNDVAGDGFTKIYIRPSIIHNIGDGGTWYICDRWKKPRIYKGFGSLVLDVSV